MSEIFTSLRDQKIKTVKQLRNADFSSSGFEGFTILTTLPLQNDIDVTKIEDSIVRLSNPADCNAKILSIKNSVIIGDISYAFESDDNFRGTSIFIKDSILVGTLTIASAEVDRVELFGSSVDEIKICNCRKVNYLSAWQAKVISFNLEFSYIKTFIVPPSAKIGSLSFLYSSIGDNSNVSLGAFFPKYLGVLLDSDMKKKVHRTIKFLIPIEQKPQKSPDRAKSDIAKWNTHGVLRNFFNTEFNVDTYAKYKYLSCLGLSETSREKFFLWATGAFLLPSRFIIHGAMIVVIFAFFYSLFPQSFTPCLGNMFSREALSQAFYISLISFTTIGFGDIVPKGAMRFLTILEGCLGVVIFSSFVVSLVKKYIEGKESKMIPLSKEESSAQTNSRDII